METFFSQYENFSRNPEAGLIKEFNRLAVTQRWSQHDKQNFRKTFRSAMVDEFNLRYGIDDKSLASWQNLCRVFNIQPIPESINKCKKQIKKTHVNLVDLIQLKGDGPVRVFKKLNDLRKYTKNSRKCFPKDDAKAGGILRHLLRKII